MKRFIALLLVSMCGLTACSNSNSTEKNVAETTTEAVDENVTVTENNDLQQDANGESKTLIAYFSRVGNTDFTSDVDAVTSASLNKDNENLLGNAQILANYVQEVTGGDVFLIESVNKYPVEYRDTVDVASEEKENDARPELVGKVDNMESYDRVVLIYPNWWGTIPMPVATFLESYDFSGKTIIPICTHEGSSMGSSESDIEKLAANAVVSEGLAVRGKSVTESKSDVESFLNNN